MSEKPSKVIGNYLRHAREKSGLTQHAVANLLNVEGPQLISNWETAESPLPLRALIKLVKIYSLDLDELQMLILREEEEFFLLRRE